VGVKGSFFTGEGGGVPASAKRAPIFHRPRILKSQNLFPFCKRLLVRTSCVSHSQDAL
jgi:hypothetical protein